MDESLMKPLAVAGVAMALDQFVLGETNIMRTAYFGGAVVVGSYASEFVAPLVKDVAGFIPTVSKSLYDSKTLAERIIEISASSGCAYVLNKYVLGNDIYRDEVLKRIAVIAVSDVIATYALDYFNGQKLQFLTDSN